jgi:acyl-CoA thioesterase
VTTIDDFVRALTLERIGEDRYRAPSVDLGHGVIFGGQLLGQAVVAACSGNDGKQVKTVHTIFARSGSPAAPLEITVDRMHAGRAFASSTVSIAQDDRLCARSLVLLTADEPDFIRHADPAPRVPAPEACANGRTEGAWETRIVGGVDVDDPVAIGPPELDVWSRFVGAPADPRLDQALLAYSTDGFLIGAAMRPHAGVGQSQAHVSVSTGVISHTLTFHEPCRAGEWLLLSHRSTHAGHGRSYGRGTVFTAHGELVASFVQDAMIRPLEGGGSGPRL